MERKFGLLSSKQNVERRYEVDSAANCELMKK